MLKKLLTDTRGSALVPALMITVMMLTFGMAMLTMTEGNQSDSRRERERESSFELAEGVLNAQIYRLSTRWPAKNQAVYPPLCTQATTGDPDCPGSLTSNFTGADYTKGATWKVQVRDNTSASANFYTEGIVGAGGTTARDLNEDNFLWVRAEATVAGRKRTLVALVEAENVALNFPNATLVAGKFEVSNNGKKVMIDTNGESNEWAPGAIIVRCALGPGCDEWEKGKGQVEPDTVTSNPLQPKALSAEALDLLRARAQAEGNYYTGCAPSLQGDQPGELVFMEDAAGCKFNGNHTYNSPTQPGYVVIANGMPTLNGNATFYGVIYHANVAESSDMVITLTGNISVYGSIVIDGAGGLSAGSSKVNLVYNPNAFAGLKATGTAGIVQNTFREIQGTA